MNRRVAWSPHLLVVLLFCSGSAFAEPPAVFEGRVTTEDGQPLDAAHVFARRDDVAVAESRTDAEGRFRIELARGGPVEVYVGKTMRGPDEDGRASWVTLSARALEADPAKGPLALVATVDSEESVVRVRVRSPEGNVSGAHAEAWPRSYPPDARVGWTGDRTDAIGRADCDGLPQVPVDLRIGRRPPWCPARVRGALADPEGIDLHRIEVVRERLLEGRVVDVKGEPVAGWGVMARDTGTSTALAWGGLTGLDGRFRIGVPETWSTATLLVGCDLPDEASPHRLAVEIEIPDDPAWKPPEIVVKRGEEKPPSASADDESRRVMETVLREHYLDPRQVVLILTNRLALDVMDDEVSVSRYLGDGVQASAEADLRRKVEARGLLPPGLEVGKPRLVLEPKWIGYLYELHDFRMWREFYERFPDSGGYVVLSPVGFSEDGTQAVIHVACIRWRLNADGYYHLLEKKDGVWHIVKREMTWVS